MVQDDTAGSPAGGPGIEAGGLVDVAGGVTLTLTVVDKNGKLIYTGTALGGDTAINPIAHGVTMPLRVAVSSHSGSGNTIIYWWVKK